MPMDIQRSPTKDQLGIVIGCLIGSGLEHWRPKGEARTFIREDAYECIFHWDQKPSLIWKLMAPDGLLIETQGIHLTDSKELMDKVVIVLKHCDTIAVTRLRLLRYT